MTETAMTTEVQPTRRGRVKRVLQDEGFGFISDLTTGDDYFFHETALQNAVFTEAAILKRLCEFEWVVRPDGKLRAVAVRILSPEPKPTPSPRPTRHSHRPRRGGRA